MNGGNTPRKILRKRGKVINIFFINIFVIFEGVGNFNREIQSSAFSLRYMGVYSKNQL